MSPSFTVEIFKGVCWAISTFSFIFVPCVRPQILVFLVVHLFFSPLSNSGLKFIFAKSFHQVFLFDFLLA